MQKNGRRELVLTEVADKSSDDDSVNFEEAMLQTGNGRYNLMLLLVCGLGLIGIGFQYSISAYILPSAQCDLQLSSSQMGLLNAAFMIGATPTTILWASIADAIGRKKILVFSLCADGCITLLSSFSQNFPVLFAFRCVSGIIIGGPSSIMYPFLGEFHGEKTRATAICYLAFFFVSPWVLLPALAWIVIPLRFNVVVYGYVFNSWRLFLSLISLPSLIGGLLLSKYPESPKFLLSQGQDMKALQIMRDMFVVNTNGKAQNYPVRKLISKCPTKDVNGGNVSFQILKKMRNQLRYLCSSTLRNYVMLCGFMAFANMFGYFGLGLWLPELFNRFENYQASHPNVTVTVCELAYLQHDNNGSMNTKSSEYFSGALNLTSLQNAADIFINSPAFQTLPDNVTEVCDNSVNTKVFVNTIIIGLSCMIGSLATGYLANRWNRKVLPIVTMLISGISGCFIYFLRTSTQNLIVSCIFTAFISMANTVIYTYIADVFPTNVSAMAAGVAAVVGRTGSIVSNLVFGWLFDISCEIPIFLVGGLIIFGGLLGIFLPNNPLVLPHKNGNQPA